MRLNDAVRNKVPGTPGRNTENTRGPLGQGTPGQPPPPPNQNGQGGPGTTSQPPPPQQPINAQVDQKTQEQIDIFISNGMMMIHNSKVSDGILSKILKDPDRIKAIAEAIVLIINHLADSAAKNGQALTNETLVFGSNFLLGELISLAEAAGMQKLNEAQKAEVLQRGVGMFIDDAVKQGRITKDQLVALGEQAKQTPEGQKIMQQGMQQGGM